MLRPDKVADDFRGHNKDVHPLYILIYKTIGPMFYKSIVNFDWNYKPFITNK